MKKISSLFLLTAAISLVSAVPTFAANESSTNASPPSFDSIAPFVAGEATFPANESSANTSPSSIDSIAPFVAGESTSVVVAPVTYQFSNPINGAGQYGKITLESAGKASLYVYYNTGNGVWTSMNIHDPGTSFILLDAGQGSDSLTFYMNLGWQYKVYVFAETHTAKGYIRNYQ
ncbi:MULTISPECIES: hypothetical protein [Paenibacillus]|jgi:hypothetical protein|uniref:Uncharacterized protein n=1 Tax=Paenibacillus odorifer TaxID=189426 RepID=A0ABX3GQM1_9BACL|nr:hypothetical protein [Paenibacillus odorifer]OMD34884.1 hypothetical protein BSO21_10195 [Paenibacillus odorifer]OME03119.1 hypothetical protein BSK64_18285 [Paenibacillus odorifer]